jgi:GNAT superfamily N-acetyltransferase
MLVVEHESAIVGGTIAMHLIAIESWAQGIGLGRRLLQAAEGETAAAGLRLATHADPNSKGFYLRLGYSDGGKRASRLHMSKGVPLSPRLVELRTRRWREQVGDLRRGVVVTTDCATGIIPPLPW